MSSTDIIDLAGCLIFDQAGRLLLLHRAGRDEWEIPGGRVDDSDEPYEVAAARQMYEELGVDVEITDTMGATSFERDGTTYRFHWHRGVVADSATPQPQPASEADAARYVSRDELLTMHNLSPTLQALVEDWPEYS